MTNINIFFIIHVSKSKKIKKIIQSFFKNRNEKIFLFTSKYRGHTSVLTKNAIKQNANIIVATTPGVKPTPNSITTGIR